MTTPTEEDLAEYAIGHYAGDAAALERRVDEDPEVAARLAGEMELAALLRAAAREIDLVDGEAAVAVEHVVTAMPTRSKRRATWSLAIAAVAIAAAVAIVLAMRRETARHPAAPPADVTVKLNIVTQPRGVAVTLDGRYRGLTPLELRVPRSSTPGALVLRHISYRTVTKELVLSTDLTVDIALESTGAPVAHDGRFGEEQCMGCHRPN
jgi:hypothetical protein